MVHRLEKECLQSVGGLQGAMWFCSPTVQVPGTPRAGVHSYFQLPPESPLLHLPSSVLSKTVFLKIVGLSSLLG